MSTRRDAEELYLESSSGSSLLEGRQRINEHAVSPLLYLQRSAVVEDSTRDHGVIGHVVLGSLPLELSTSALVSKLNFVKEY